MASSVALHWRADDNSVAIEPLTSPLYEAGAFIVTDPQGRRMSFGLARARNSAAGMPGSLWHTVAYTIR